MKIKNNVKNLLSICLAIESILAIPATAHAGCTFSIAKNSDYFEESEKQIKKERFLNSFSEFVSFLLLNQKNFNYKVDLKYINNIENQILYVVTYLEDYAWIKNYTKTNIEPISIKTGTKNSAQYTKMMKELQKL